LLDTDSDSRRAFKVIYTSRDRYRTTRRSVEETIKLARLARELVEAYLEVVSWRGEERVLKLKR
jgi:hypothetical protein